MGRTPEPSWDYSIEPTPYEHKVVDKVVAVFDTETDPFLPGRIVKPFTCGFYIPSHNFYIDFWGDDCIHQFFAWLKEVTAEGGEFEGVDFLILVHNGGNFDFYFFVEYFDPSHKPFIINGRLVRINAQGQEFRDSYSMIPVALGTYDKLSIDYRCMERGFRDIFKDTILEYQKRDCTSLAELVTEWYSMFGNKLTMASVALPMLNSYHGFERFTESMDEELRPYYFGGRNQCFEVGVIKGDFKVYDINSSYPDVMRRYKHPISDIPRYDNKITADTHFAHIRAWSNGALPMRNANGGLYFPVGEFDFYACIHEIRAGIETETLKIKEVYKSIYFDAETDFSDFIDTYYSKRLEASANNDEIRKLFYKLVMNSSYGKFAQDPRKYENWLFDPDEIPTPLYCDHCYQLTRRKEYVRACDKCATKEFNRYGWYLHSSKDGRNIYASPQRIRAGSFYNVATAASITSAARASLLRGIQAATRPIYCDTDSVICLDLRAGNGIELHPKNLGAWDTEASGDTVCIAGKKLYAIFKDGELIKKASKGVKLTGDEIARVCAGEVIEYAHPVPKFSLHGDTRFTTRKIRATGNEDTNTDTTDTVSSGSSFSLTGSANGIRGNSSDIAF